MKADHDLIETDRTLLRPFAAADAEELLSLFREPEVRRFLLDDMVPPRSWMRDEILASDRRFALGGMGLWSIRFSTRGSIIGFVGFREYFKPPQLQLLYGLLPAFWGCGLATEAAACIRDRAFHQYAIDEINAAVDAPNKASRKVLRRLGLSAVESNAGVEAGAPLCFALRRKDWLAMQQEPRAAQSR